LPIAITTAAIAQHATHAAISWPYCCRHGDAETSQPVFRSWLMSRAAARRVAL